MKTLLNIFIAFILGCSPYTTLADTPISYQSLVRVYGDNRNYCALVDDTEVTVFKGRCVTGEITYSIQGRHTNAHLSSNGEYFIAFHPGVNLIPLDSQSQTIMIQIWKSGEKKVTITLGELLKSMDSLKRTVSHFNWGHVKTISDNEIEIETVERDIKVSIPDGRIRFL